MASKKTKILTKNNSTVAAKRYLPALLLFVLLGIGVLVATILSLQSQDTRQKASEEDKPVVMMMPASKEVKAGQLTQVGIWLNTHSTSIDGVQSSFQVRGVELTDLRILNRDVPGLESVFEDVRKVEDESGAYYVVKFALVSENPSLPFNSGEEGVIISALRFRAPESGTLDIKFNNNLTKVAENGTGNNTLATVENRVYQIQEAISDATGGFECQNDADCGAGNYCYFPHLDCPGGYGTCPDVASSECRSLTEDDDRLAKLQVACVAGGGTWDADIGNGDSCLLAAGASLPNIAGAGCLCPNTNEDMCWSGTSCELTEDYINNGGGPRSGFGLQVSFAGVNGDVGAIEAMVKYAPTGSSNFVEESVIFTYAGELNDKSFYSASVALPSGFVFGQEYSVAIKGEKHVQRIFRNVIISEGLVKNVINTPLLPGDLPTQDGVANIADIDRLLAIMAKPGDQTVDDLYIADVNYDGAVNAADMSLVLATFSSISDPQI